MRTAILLLAAFALLPAFAEGKAAMRYGFAERDSPEVPAAVKARSRFIYRLDLPFFTTTKKASYEDLLALPSFPTEAKEDIETCRAAGLENCVIRFGAWRGSAFLDESGDAIWTNCHMVHGWIAYERQGLFLEGETDILKALMKRDIPLSLTDAEGRIQEIGSARLKAFVASGLKNQAQLECSLGNDAVKLQLGRALAERGIPRVRKIEAGEMLYVGGFPRETKSRASRGRADSNGESFYWTLGAHLPKGAASEEYFGDPERYSLALGNPYAEALLADGIEGMSGGPVLNERGEVTGIYKGYLPLDKENKDIPLVSVLFSNLRFVEIFSEGF